MAEPQLRWGIGATDQSRAAFNSLNQNFRRSQSNVIAFQRGAEQSFVGFTGRLREAQTQVSGLAGAWRGMFAGIGVTTAITTLRNLVGTVGHLADEARRAGVAAEDLQAIAFAARQAGVETDTATTLFQKLRIEIAEAAAKGGDLAKLLKDNNIALRDQSGRMRDIKELFFDITDLIKNAKSDQDASLIAQLAFTRAAADAVPFLQQGSEAIRQGMTAARDAGAVIDEELVKAADEFDDRWTAAWDTFSARAKSAVLSAMVGLDGISARMDQNFADYQAKQAAASTALGGLLEMQAKLEAQIKFSEETKTGLDQLPFWRKQLEEINRQLEMAGPAFESFGRGVARPSNAGPAWESLGRGEGLGRRTTVIDLEKDSKKATKATNDHAEAVKRLNDALRAQAEAQKKLASDMDEFRDDAREGLQTVVDILRDGKIEAQELGSLLASIGSKLLNTGLDQLSAFLFGAPGTTQPGAFGNLFPNLMPARPTMAFPGVGDTITRNPFALARAAPAAKVSPASGIGPLPDVLISGGLPAARPNLLLDLIGRAEGTDRGRGYNETLGYGRFTGGARNLTGMTLDQIDDLQQQMLDHPANSFNSSALGRYQITRRTLLGLREQHGLTGDELFSPGLQDSLALSLASRRGADIGGLRNEWEGLRGVPGGDILAAFNASSKDIAKGFEGAMASANTDVAKNFSSVFDGMLSSIGGGSAPGGGGGFASFLSGAASLVSTFTGLFDSGGSIPAGKWGVKGGKPELLFGGSSGLDVFPMDAMSRRGGGQSITVGGTTINVAGSVDKQTLAVLRREMAENNQKQANEFKRSIGAINTEHAMLQG